MQFVLRVLYPERRRAWAAIGMAAACWTAVWVLAVPAAQSAGTWSPTGSMHVARAGHVAALLPNGKVLVVGGDGTDGWPHPPATAELYDPGPGTWSFTGSMQNAIGVARGVALVDGRVLVLGNTECFACGPQAEIYNPAAGTWSVTGAPGFNDVSPDTAHPAALVLLQNGQVLGDFAAHDSLGQEVSRPNLYNPATGTWSPTGGHNIPRPSATLLNNGQVLATGNDGDAGSAELYDPIAGTWAPTGQLGFQRTDNTQTLLMDGRVLIVNNVTTVAEIYDPPQKTWTTTGEWANTRGRAVTTLLGDGTVLVTGGCCDLTLANDAFASSELYDPLTESWSPAGNMSTTRMGHTATRLPDGRVLVAGGASNPSGVKRTSADLYVGPPPGAAPQVRLNSNVTNPRHPRPGQPAQRKHVP